jgi:hypothetical protein
MNSFCTSKVVTVHMMEAYGGVEVLHHPFPALTVGGGEWSATHSGHYTSGERAQSWVGPRVCVCFGDEKNLLVPARN